MSDLGRDYKRCLFINLLQKHRDYENRLTLKMEKMFNICQSKCAKITYYDFHTETKGGNFHRINDLLSDIEEVMHNKFCFFVEDRHTGKMVKS